MSMYLIGDVQGCDEPLQRLLDTIAFSPSRDTLFMLGDLVNRGPDSAKVLRRLMGYGDAARCLLGNHDLHLLAVSQGLRKFGRHDTFADVLAAPDRELLLQWLRTQRLAMTETLGGSTLIMVHAGILPTWNAMKTIASAREVEAALQSANYSGLLQSMYGNTPDKWRDDLAGADRLRVIINALTRMRFCTPQGAMEFDSSGSSDTAPAGYMPWFEVPGRQTESDVVAFGHWSTLGWLDRPHTLALDSGCVWGGCLTGLRVEACSSGFGLQTERIQVKCPQAQKPY